MLIRRINDSSGPTARVAAAPRVGWARAPEGTYADMQPGALKHTGRSLDVARLRWLSAVVFGDDLAFTRDGRLQVDGEGWLRISGPVDRGCGRTHPPVGAGRAGPSPCDRDDGIVRVDGEQAGQLASTASSTGLSAAGGDNLWLATPAAGVEVEAARVAPEHLEASINVVSEW